MIIFFRLFLSLFLFIFVCLRVVVVILNLILFWSKLFVRIVNLIKLISILFLIVCIIIIYIFWPRDVLEVFAIIVIVPAFLIITIFVKIVAIWIVEWSITQNEKTILIIVAILLLDVLYWVLISRCGLIADTFFAASAVWCLHYTRFSPLIRLFRLVLWRGLNLSWLLLFVIFCRIFHDVWIYAKHCINIK